MQGSRREPAGLRHLRRHGRRLRHGGRHYTAGDYLPSIFWRYSVNDYRTYGLGYPPPGTRWVYVDNAIYLIDEYDGYILDVIRDAWRW